MRFTITTVDDVQAWMKFDTTKDDAALLAELQCHGSRYTGCGNGKVEFQFTPKGITLGNTRKPAEREQCKTISYKQFLKELRKSVSADAFADE